MGTRQRGLFQQLATPSNRVSPAARASRNARAISSAVRPASQGRVLPRPIARPVLAHDVKVRARGKLGQKRDHLRSAGQIVGEHQVPHEQSPSSYAPPVEGEIAHLPMHLAEGRLGRIGVVLDAGIAQSPSPHSHT